MISKSWSIILFETANGNKPVEEFIKSLEKPTIAKVIHIIDLLSIHGHSLPMPHSKKITTDIYELRIRGKQEVRILYTYKKESFYLLHGFKKPRNSIPTKEIKTAISRLKELEKNLIY